MDAVAVPQMYPVRRGTLKPLGKGSYGAIFVGEIPGGVCAVKEIHEILSKSPGKIIDDFKQECDFISKLRHPHIVQFFGLYSKENLLIPALVTEKLSTDLDSLLSTTPPSAYFPLGLKFSILRDVAGGLLYLHSQTPPIIHRDLTARNVLLDAAMVAKIADFGMARLVPDGTNRLTAVPGNWCYMPPEAMGSDCNYDKSLDVFSFGVLALFTLTEMFPKPKGVKSTKDGKVVSLSEVERRHTFFETLRNEVKDRDEVVEAIKECLSDTPKGRPEVQHMLSLMQSAKEKNLTKELKMNKLELVRIIKRERALHETKVNTLKRERDDFKLKHDKLRREEDKLRSENDKLKRERDELKKKREALKKDRNKQDEHAMKISQKERERDREFRQQMEEKKEECQLTIKKKEEEVAEIVAQMKQEKEEAVKQKEREIVEELREILWEKPREKEEAVKQKERGINEELREELCAKPMKPNLRIVMMISLCIGILSVFLLMQVQVQVRGTGEGVSLIHNEAQCPGTFQQPNRTETSEKHRVQCENECITEKDKCKEERDECKKEQVMCKEERDECKKEQVTCKEERDECKKEQVTCKGERDECKKEQVTCKGERDECKKEQVTCNEERDECKKEQVTCKEERDECKKEQVMCKEERDECEKEQVKYKEKRDAYKKEQVTCKGERDECKKDLVTCKEERDQWRGMKKIAVMIIGSIIPPPSGWIMSAVEIPQSPASRSDEDRQVLTELGLPPDQWNNLNALMALYNKTEHYDVFPPQVSKPGMELSRSYVLEQIEFLLAKQQFKAGKTNFPDSVLTPGANYRLMCAYLFVAIPTVPCFLVILAFFLYIPVILHYYGNGQRYTGDWCFQDGFITFRDIADLYMKHGRGRTLTIVPDCHSSGQWVSQCAEFLDEQGVKPCGHSAMEKGILLKVYASCQTGQDSTELLYTTRAMKLKEDGHVHNYLSKELSAQQRTRGVDFTRVRCKKGEEEECSIAPDATWSTAEEVISHRLKIVRGTNKGRPVWHFVLLDDDAEKIKDFIDKTQGENAGKYTTNPSQYGKILKSGWGKDPTPEDQAWIDNYGYP